MESDLYEASLDERFTEMPGLSIASASQLLNLAVELSGDAESSSEAAENRTCPAGRSHRPSRQVPVEFSKAEAANSSTR